MSIYMYRYHLTKYTKYVYIGSQFDLGVGMHIILHEGTESELQYGHFHDKMDCYRNCAGGQRNKASCVTNTYTHTYR